MSSALAAAAEAIAAARWPEAAAKLIEAWQAARCGRIARALAIVDTRLPAPKPLDNESGAHRERHWHLLVENADEEVLRRILAAPWPGLPRPAQARVDALGAYASPRISTELLALHRRSLFTSHAGDRLSRSIYQQLLANGDHAVTEELERADSDDRRRLGAAIMKRKRPHAPVFSPAADVLLARIEKLLSAGGASNPEQLLAAVYEAPHDDGPRLVYADALIEAGDLRGEFITLQLRGAPTRREKQLLKAAGRQWFDGLDKDGATDVTLARGFPAVATMAGGTLRVPAWATIETLHLEGEGALAGTERLRGLRSLCKLRAEHLEGFELDHPVDYLSLECDDGIGAETSLAPRVLLIYSFTHARVIQEATEITELPIARRLETLQLGLPMRNLVTAIEAVRPGIAVEISGWWTPQNGAFWAARVTEDRLELRWSGVAAHAAIAIPELQQYRAAIKSWRGALTVTGVDEAQALRALR